MSFDEIKTRELASETVRETERVTVRLIGSAETEAMQLLAALLKSVHAVAKGDGLKEVAVDLRRLEFMNSSCFKAFVSFIDSLQESSAPAAPPYRLRFLSDPGKHWQSRSLGALASFAGDLVTIDAG